MMTMQVVDWAIWFHDVIYDPQKHDNEEQSAKLAMEMLQGHLPTETLQHIEQYILATKTHSSPNLESDDNLRIFLDADLGILGAPAQQYQQYAACIRKEYTHLEDAVFFPGRAQVLSRFLARPQLFYSQHFQKLYEDQARSNLEQELLDLKK